MIKLLSDWLFWIVVCVGFWGLWFICKLFLKDEKIFFNRDVE